jgi:hypothetical protein
MNDEIYVYRGINANGWYCWDVFRKIGLSYYLEYTSGNMPYLNWRTWFNQKELRNQYTDMVAVNGGFELAEAEKRIKSLL